MLKLTQTESLAIRSVDTDITHVVDLVNTIIVQRVRGRRVDNRHALTIDIDVQTRTLNLIGINTLHVVIRTLLRIHRSHHEKPQRLVWVTTQKLHESHNRQILTLALTVSIRIEKDNRLRG